MARESLVIYYDPKQIDLKGMIKQLANKQGTRFENRSMSDIAGMLLRESLLLSEASESEEETVNT